MATIDTTLYPFVDLLQNAQVRSGQITGPASYSAGGFAVNLGDDLKMSEVWAFICEPFSDGTDVLIARYDYDNNKIKLFRGAAQTHTHDLLLKNAAVADAAGTRVNAGANLLGANTGADLTITGDGANGGIVSTTLAEAALVEVDAATNVSGYTARFIATGK